MAEFSLRAFDLSDKNIVVLTGAGISSESGLKTFRDADGLWEGHRIEDVATPEAFTRQPAVVQRFYNLRRQQLNEVHPNLAHEALARFQRSHHGGFTLITQNVDDLHERAGSRSVLHMHGELRKVRCLDTGEVFNWTGDLNETSSHPVPGRPAGRLRPHICWFGEIPFYLDEIETAVRAADVFVAIGTSGVVYPAAGLAQIAGPRCLRLLLNKDNAENNSMFDHVIIGPATQIVPRLFNPSN